MQNRMVKLITEPTSCTLKFLMPIVTSFDKLELDLILVISFKIQHGPMFPGEAKGCVLSYQWYPEEILMCAFCAYGPGIAKDKT